MKKLILPILLVTTFASCKNTWDESDKKSFYQACTEDAQKSGCPPGKIKPYCDCVLGKIIAKYPNVTDALEHIDSLAKDSSLISCKIEREK